MKCHLHGRLWSVGVWKPEEVKPAFVWSKSTKDMWYLRDTRCKGEDNPFMDMPHRLAAYFKKTQRVKSLLINICCGLRGLLYTETTFISREPILPIFRSACESNWTPHHLFFSLVGLSTWLRPNRWQTDEVSGNMPPKFPPKSWRRHV